MKPLEFWFEFASTYSYPAAMRIERLAAEQGITVLWRAFLLGPIFRAQGWNDSPFNIYEAKGRYMWRDLERVCATDGLAFSRPSVFPRSGLTAARIACHFAEAPWLPAFVRAVYTANFADDQDIASHEVLAACLETVGADPGASLADAAAPDAKTSLRDQTEAAVRRGVFGAPSFILDDELFWGNDRLVEALAWARR